MKKILFQFFAFLFAFSAAAGAQERILDFASVMNVREDGSAVIEETITINAEHVNIRRGIYRDIPNTESEPVKFISLFMDGQPHPSFIERPGNNLRINFGDDNYLSKGIHTYQLVYSIKNLVKDFEDYDEIYWNVTGSNWAFEIERASLLINFPQKAEIMNSLVSLYTGHEGSKDSDAVRKSEFRFETTKPLYSGEGFTVAVPFEKGVVESHKITRARSRGNSGIKNIILISAAAVLFVVFIAYLAISWLAVGRDPKDITVTEFVPPEGISPAFMRCLWRRGTDKKMFAAALISLAMKDKIEIIEQESLFQKQAVLKLKDKNTEGLPKEEEHIIKSLFAHKTEFTISRANWNLLSLCINHIEQKLGSDKKEYVFSNSQYIKPAAAGLVLFQLFFILAGSDAPVFIFLNLHYSIFLTVFTKFPRNAIIKIAAFILINLFYAPFFFSIGQSAGTAASVAEGLFLLSFWAMLVYTNIIDNLTEKGRELFKHIRGFYRYMTIAEEHRVALSVPVDDEKIFADYLPYAFAFDMENKWMARFEKTISQAAIERSMQNIGGRNALARGLLLSSINSAVPKSGLDSNSSSGSGGGGFSGGGFGGGGGGGR